MKIHFLPNSFPPFYPGARYIHTCTAGSICTQLEPSIAATAKASSIIDAELRTIVGPLCTLVNG